MEMSYLDALVDRAITSKTCSFPSSILELINVIGVSDTYRITQAHGGTRIYIPKKIPPSKCDLSISYEGVSALQKGYGGETIEIPKSSSIDRFIRNLTISKMIDEGCSAKVIAKKFNLSVRHVNNIKAHLENASPEISLGVASCGGDAYGR